MQASLIDSHCHLNYDYTPKTTVQLIQEAKDAGVEVLMTIGTELGTMEEVQAISEKFSNVYHTVGVHPHEAITLTDESMIQVRSYASHPKCKAIGEIGLDYHYDHSPPEVQKKRLNQQLEIAADLKLPVVIHSREAEEDLYQALKEHAKRLPSDLSPGVIHCFSGTQEFGQRCIDLGFYISFSGILTFKNAEDIRTAAKHFPLERILVETDSPYLSPVPHRGKKCEPSMVRLTALKLAEIKGISFEEVAKATTHNAKQLFQI